MNRTQVIERLNKFEGKVPYMYRCTGGEATIRRYYAKWTEEYQSRQDALIRKIHDTNLARAEVQVSN
jgi:hypothetical protein